ncbi:MAG: hypothetical protein R3C32_15220 [Chloroflexota bacterium]
MAGGRGRTSSRDTAFGVWVVDVEGSERVAAGGAIDFTFWWPDAGRWRAATSGWPSGTTTRAQATSLATRPHGRALEAPAAW